MIEQAKKILKDVFGYNEFRSLQEPIIENVLNKRDTLVIMPTGGGKSLCYQIPALIFKGLTVVVSPLISLMKDQVEQLRELGVEAVLLNSSLSYEEYLENSLKVRRNEAKLLYVAPETLLKDRTLEMLAALPVPLDCITIDEAHCISEWGHDFRPEYRQIMAVRERFPGAVCMALTATATPRVREDIKTTLKFEQSNQFIASFDRNNLFLRIIPKQGPFNQLLNFLEKHKDQSGIIYCFTRKTVDEVAEKLAKKGFSVRPYHAGLEEPVRRENQELFIRDDVQIIVATIAFGMGINKSNIRFVVHHDLPKNIESYYQEIGRGGRDGVRSDCLLLFGYGDLRKIRYFIDQKEEKEKQIAEAHLMSLLRFAESPICRRVPLLDHFGETYKEENCGMCDNCVLKDEDLVDLTVPAQKFMSCVRKTGQIFGAAYIIDVLRGSKVERLLKNNHDEISTYGIGTDLSKKQWYYISNQFIQKGLIFKDPEYGSLKVTAKGIEVLRSREVFKGLMQEESEARVQEKVAGREKAAKSKVSAGALKDEDRRLYELLRQKRKQLADQTTGGKAHYIFNDRTLIEMAVLNPTVVEDLLAVHGVGGLKLRKYGDIFFDIISKYRREHGRGIGTGDYGVVPAEEYGGPKWNGGSDDLDIVDVDGEEVTEKKPRKTRKRTGKRKYEQAGELYIKGLSLAEIAEQMGVVEDYVLNYLYDYVRKEGKLVAGRLLTYSKLDAEMQAKVIEAFQVHGTKRLSEPFEALGGEVGYFDLKLLRLYLVSSSA